MDIATASDISTESLSEEERRGCVRIGLSAFPCEAVLSDGASMLRAECVNQSAEGFGLRCEQSMPWAIDQKLLLNKLTGPIVARLSNKKTLAKNLQNIYYDKSKISDEEIDALWHMMTFNHDRNVHRSTIGSYTRIARINHIHG